MEKATNSVAEPEKELLGKIKHHCTFWIFRSWSLPMHGIYPKRQLQTVFDNCKTAGWRSNRRNSDSCYKKSVLDYQDDQHEDEIFGIFRLKLFPLSATKRKIWSSSNLLQVAENADWYLDGWLTASIFREKYEKFSRKVELLCSFR